MIKLVCVVHLKGPAPISFQWSDLKTLGGYVMGRLANIKEKKEFEIFLEDDNGNVLKYLGVSMKNRSRFWNHKIRGFMEATELAKDKSISIYCE